MRLRYVRGQERPVAIVYSVRIGGLRVKREEPILPGDLHVEMRRAQIRAQGFIRAAKVAERGLRRDHNFANFANEWFEKRYVQRSIGRKQTRWSTAVKVRERLDQWVLPVIGHLPPSDVQPSDIEEIFTRMRAKGRANATLNVTRAMLVGMFEYLRNVGWHDIYLERNPARVTQPFRNNGKMRDWPRLDELGAIVAAAMDRQSAIPIALMSYCGLRMQEARNLRWRNIEIHPRHAPAAGVLRFAAEDVKEGRPKIVPLPREVAALLPERPHYASPDWRVLRNAPSDDTITSELKRIVKELGIPRHITPHCLRKGCAIAWDRAGVPLTAIRDFMGHADVKTTMRYLDDQGERATRHVAAAARAIALLAGGH